jgi:hypothetical protein
MGFAIPAGRHQGLFALKVAQRVGDDLFQDVVNDLYASSLGSRRVQRVDKCDQLAVVSVKGTTINYQTVCPFKICHGRTLRFG